MSLISKIRLLVWQKKFVAWNSIKFNSLSNTIVVIRPDETSRTPNRKTKIVSRYCHQILTKISLLNLNLLNTSLSYNFAEMAET